MFVASTELKRNLGKYLKIIEKEDIIILKRGRPVAKLLALNVKDEAPITESLLGVLKGATVDLKKSRAERLKKYEGSR